MGDRTRRTPVVRATAVLAAVLAAGTVWAAAGDGAWADDPVATSLDPASGSLEGGTVVVHGTGFIPGHTAVWWDGVMLMPVDTTPTTVEVVAPAHEAGEVDVQVQVGEGVAAVLVYRYVAPEVAAPSEPAITDPVTDGPEPIEPVEQRVRDDEPEPREAPRGRLPGGGHVPDAAPEPPRLAETGTGTPVGAVVLLVAGAACVALTRRPGGRARTATDGEVRG